MRDLHTQLPDNRHVQAYLPIINATTAQAKAEKCPERAYHLADLSHDLIELVSRGVDFLKNYAGDSLNRAYERTVQRCEAIKAGGNDDLDIKSCLHNLSNAYAQPAQAALTGGEAIARGIYQGVAQLADRTYWKNRALGMVEAIKFVGSIMAEDVWLESWETEYRTAVVTDNQKACDQLLERFEKHEFQPLSSAEQGIRQACIQLQTLSWDQLVEHGAHIATSLALDCVILKAGEFALSPAGRDFIHDITETLKLPPPYAQEYMIELAGIGKIALEDGADVAIAVVKNIQKNPNALAQEGKTTVQAIKKAFPEIAGVKKIAERAREFLNVHPKIALKNELLIHKIKVDFLKEVKPKFDNIEKLVDAALAPVKGNTTAIGRAFQKHSTREGTAFFGDITGDILKNTEQGMNYLKEILECPLAQVILKNHDVYGGILDIRLPDGMGARWLNNGEKFIGFLERRTKDYHG